jgi:DNA-binding MarR family transcriptional regulator
MDEVLDLLHVSRELHVSLLEPVCKKYQLTFTELLILLFLKDNATQNTATGIVENLKIAKSYVSASIHSLEQRGYVRGSHEGHNRKTIRLYPCAASGEIIREGQLLQEQFRSILVRGFSREELDGFKNYAERIAKNAREHLNGQE